MKEVKGWVVIDPDGEVIYGSFNPNKRRDSIYAFRGHYDKFFEWSWWRNQGYRCIRVTLTQDKGE